MPSARRPTQVTPRLTAPSLFAPKNACTSSSRAEDSGRDGGSEDDARRHGRSFRSYPSSQTDVEYAPRSHAPRGNARRDAPRPGYSRIGTRSVRNWLPTRSVGTRSEQEQWYDAQDADRIGRGGGATSAWHAASRRRGPRLRWLPRPVLFVQTLLDAPAVARPFLPVL